MDTLHPSEDNRGDFRKRDFGERDCNGIPHAGKEQRLETAAAISPHLFILRGFRNALHDWCGDRYTFAAFFLPMILVPAPRWIPTT
jgi:hypothetical protein